MIIYYYCTRDSALLLSLLLTCHPYIEIIFILVVVDNRQVISLQVMLSIITYIHIIIATYKEIDIVILQKAYGQVFIRQYAMNNHRILHNCRLCCL